MMANFFGHLQLNKLKSELFRFDSMLLAFDFDGTLAPIVSNRGAAIMRPRTRALLGKLVKLAPVVIITGRALRDIRGRVPVSSKWLIGNHGLERPDLPEKERLKYRELIKRWKRQLLSSLGNRVSGIDIEDKDLTLSVHFRQALNRTYARKRLLKIFAGLTPAPHVIPGKCVFNVLPKLKRGVIADKGGALLSLLRERRLSRALYVGDDDTDEAVFKLPRSKVIGVRVGMRAGSRARWMLNDQNEVDLLLSLLIEQFQQFA